jgi:hypothetical protein
MQVVKALGFAVVMLFVFSPSSYGGNWHLSCDVLNLSHYPYQVVMDGLYSCLLE